MCQTATSYSDCPEETEDSLLLVFTVCREKEGELDKCNVPAVQQCLLMYATQKLLLERAKCKYPIPELSTEAQRPSKSYLFWHNE